MEDVVGDGGGESAVGGGYPMREEHKGGKAMPRNNTLEIKRKKSGYDNKR